MPVANGSRHENVRIWISHVRDPDHPRRMGVLGGWLRRHALRRGTFGLGKPVDVLRSACIRASPGPKTAMPVSNNRRASHCWWEALLGRLRRVPRRSRKTSQRFWRDVLSARAAVPADWDPIFGSRSFLDREARDSEDRNAPDRKSVV